LSSNTKFGHCGSSVTQPELYCSPIVMHCKEINALRAQAYKHFVYANATVTKLSSSLSQS